MAKKEKIDSPGNKKSVFGLIGSTYKKGLSKIDDKVAEKLLSKKDYKNYMAAKESGEEFPISALKDYGANVRAFLGTETEYDKNNKKKK